MFKKITSNRPPDTTVWTAFTGSLASISMEASHVPNGSLKPDHVRYFCNGGKHPRFRWMLSFFSQKKYRKRHRTAFRTTTLNGRNGRYCHDRFSSKGTAGNPYHPRQSDGKRKLGQLRQPANGKSHRQDADPRKRLAEANKHHNSP